jgi:hypothetical protein
MKEIYSRIYAGDDADYEKVKDSPDWRILRCAKEGPGGHRETLGYTERAAPKGPNHLFVEKPRKLILNLVDHPNDPDFFPDSLIAKSLAYISDSVQLGHKILVCCNHGQSRSPSLIFLWLYLNGKLPAEYHRALRQFRQLYPMYAPSDGIRQYVKSRILAAKHKR